MKLFADTNWLVASYFNTPDNDRTGIVGRFARKYELQLLVSPVVYLEAHNVFRWITRSTNPEEWERFHADFGAKLLLLPMDWLADWLALSAKAESLFGRYSYRAKLGTFDVFLVAAALSAEATHFLSFDTNNNTRALAAAGRLKVFPELVEADKQRLAVLK